MSKFHFAILSFNHPQLTESCVESVLRHVGPEVITLVHNGSDFEHIRTLTGKFPQINHKIIERNKGYSGGVNEGLQTGFQKAEWVFFITNDCRLMSVGKVPEAPGLLAPHIFFKNREKTDSCGGLFWPSTGKLTHCKSPEEFQRGKSGAHRYVPGSAFLLHRSVFEIVGNFDESLGTFWEDVDFSVRAQKKGFELVLSQAFAVSHSGGKTTRKDPLYTTYYFQRNRLIVSRRHCPSLYGRLAFQGRYVMDWTRYFAKALGKGDMKRAKYLYLALMDSRAF